VRAPAWTSVAGGVQSSTGTRAGVQTFSTVSFAWSRLSAHQCALSARLGGRAP
jgi:hypothetical protein